MMPGGLNNFQIISNKLNCEIWPGISLFISPIHELKNQRIDPRAIPKFFGIGTGLSSSIPQFLSSSPDECRDSIPQFPNSSFLPTPYLCRLISGRGKFAPLKANQTEHL